MAWKIPVTLHRFDNTPLEESIFSDNASIAGAAGAADGDDECNAVAAFVTNCGRSSFEECLHPVSMLMYLFVCRVHNYYEVHRQRRLVRRYQVTSD